MFTSIENISLISPSLSSFTAMTAAGAAADEFEFPAAAAPADLGALDEEDEEALEGDSPRLRSDDKETSWSSHCSPTPVTALDGELAMRVDILAVMDVLVAF